VVVYVTFKGGDGRNVFETQIKSKKDYNSWFYIDFEKKVFMPKGAKCHVNVRSSNVYQLIPFAHITENTAKARERAEFSLFEFNLFEREKRSSNKYTRKSLEKDADYLFCIKSLSVASVDEVGRVENM